MGMFFKWHLGIAILLLGTTASSTVVQTTDGPIEGKTITLPFSGKEVDAYLGVPFAAPPTGENRFAPPQPLEPWNETLKVQSLPKSCFQAVPESFRKYVWFAADSEESEDCLYLNLWVPRNSTNDKRPIMVWFHGGGFVAGSSNMPLYDGSVLASESDVIVATVNYRLSVFGFLYMNTTQVPGNAGLRDQIRAIKWIRDNAQFFGGDPQRVTLFGESAGSISISFHLVNTNLESLFQYGILESGTMYLNQASLSGSEIFNNSVSVAKSLGCSANDLNETLKCLRQKNVSEIIKYDNGILPYLQLKFAPVRNGIEVPVDVDAGIQAVPPEKRKISMVGNIPRELGGFFSSFFPEKILSDEVTVSEDDMRVLLTNMDGVSDPRLQDIILHQYRNFEKKYNGEQLRVEATELGSDQNMICSSLRFVEKWTARQSQVYYYYFTHRPSKEFKVPVPEWTGTVHGDEIPFVFGRPLDTENLYTADEVKLSRKMMAQWSNFAKTGNPNEDDLGEPVWPSVTPDGNLSYLVLDLNSSVRTFLKERECYFWNNIFPSILAIQDQLNASPST